ncbi:MAG: hypothetical protein IGQ45_08930 [Cyanobacterium sp. T60_A2020_053]|nr:hypothetical protein [Cyanobacterium sp. T60_A2020_053]
MTETEKEELLRSLLHKEGNWVDWGKKCHQLRGMGITPQEIFEQTGLQNSQQNLVIVASQVYDSLVTQGVEEDTLTYYQGPRSDVLYELRILNHEERKEASLLCQEKKLNIDGAKEVAKAMKFFAHLAQIPMGFTSHPGDAVAYQYWKNAKNKKSIADKARLIGEGLKFAHSQDARSQLEKLLTDIASPSQTSSAPLLPLYRLEDDEQLPCILPVVGKFPLTVADLEKIPPVEPIEPFSMVTLPQGGSVASVPSWQVILQAQHPVVIFAQSNDLPKDTGGKIEPILVVVDLDATEWNAQHYFLAHHEGNLTFNWFASCPTEKILGRLLVIMKPRKILDEDNLTQPWQMDD